MTDGQSRKEKGILYLG